MKAQVPEHIEKRLLEIGFEVEEIQKECQQIIPPFPSQKISFTVRNSSALTDIVTDTERAQLIAFVAKLENVRDFVPQVVLDGKTCRLGNFLYAVHLISDFRPIIQNQNELIYFKTLPNVFRKKLILKDPSKGTTLAVQGEERDVTQEYLAALDGCQKAIGHIIKKSDFEYLYNGFLQHVDEEYSKRFSEDWFSGKINYTIIKHAYMVGVIVQYLGPSCTLAKLFLPYFKLGAL